MSRWLLLSLVSLGVLNGTGLFAQEPKEKKGPPPLPPPTASNVHYGPHERQVLDFWQVKSDRPTPLVVCIHGGGWVGGDKASYAAKVPLYHHAGISVASINYRFLTDASDAKITPPVMVPLKDAAMAVQYLRSRAAEWNLDKTRIGATGGSAGGFSALWLAFHDDMADPKNTDPVLRESTRLFCVAGESAQTSLDPKQLREWIPNITGGWSAFGFTGDRAKKLSPFEQYYQSREAILPLLKDISPYELLTADDPPVGLYYGGAPMMGKPQPDPLHNPNFGVPVLEKCKSLGVECELYHAGTIDPKHRTAQSFLIDKLKIKK